VIVLDASAAIEWLIRSSAGMIVDRRLFSPPVTLHVPHLLDVGFSFFAVANPVRIPRTARGLQQRLQGSYCEIPTHHSLPTERGHRCTEAQRIMGAVSTACSLACWLSVQ